MTLKQAKKGSGAKPGSLGGEEQLPVVHTPGPPPCPPTLSRVQVSRVDNTGPPGKGPFLPLQTGDCSTHPIAMAKFGTDKSLVTLVGSLGESGTLVSEAAVGELPWRPGIAHASLRRRDGKAGKMLLTLTPHSGTCYSLAVLEVSFFLSFRLSRLPEPAADMPGSNSQHAHPGYVVQNYAFLSSMLKWGQ